MSASHQNHYSNTDAQSLGAGADACSGNLNNSSGSDGSDQDTQHCARCPIAQNSQAQKVEHCNFNTMCTAWCTYCISCDISVMATSVNLAWATLTWVSCAIIGRIWLLATVNRQNRRNQMKMRHLRNTTPTPTRNRLVKLSIHSLTRNRKMMYEAMDTACKSPVTPVIELSGRNDTK